MRNLKKIFLLLMLLFISSGVFSHVDFKILNSPTGLLLNSTEYLAQLQFEDSGDIRLEMDMGAMDFFEIGVSLLFRNVIGSDDIGIDVPAPYIAFQLLSPKMGAPFFMKTGWDGKDIIPVYSPFESSRRGLFVSTTKLFRDEEKEYGSMTLGFHSPFVGNNYIGLYFLANLYVTKIFTLYFTLDDFIGFYLQENESEFKSTDFFQGGPALKVNMNRNWGLGFQFLFNGNGDFYRYFFVHYTRWL